MVYSQKKNCDSWLNKLFFSEAYCNVPFPRKCLSDFQEKKEVVVILSRVYH